MNSLPPPPSEGSLPSPIISCLKKKKKSGQLVYISINGKGSSHCLVDMCIIVFPFVHDRSIQLLNFIPEYSNIYKKP